MATLTFRAPDLARYPALRLAREVMAIRGLAGAAFNAAKEIALDRFLDGAIGFMDMAGGGRGDADRGFRRKPALEMPPRPLRMCWRWTIWQEQGRQKPP